MQSARGLLRSWMLGLGLVVVLLPDATAQAAPCTFPSVVVTIPIGISYCMDPTFYPVIQGEVVKIRTEMKTQRDSGKLLAYSSVPISPRGGGHTGTNLDIAAAVKVKLEKEYGNGLWVLNPGEHQLSGVGGKSPGGAEYMVMWASIIAGEDGSGKAFDLVHFLGPTDVRAFMGCTTGSIVSCVDRYVGVRAAADPQFRQDVAEKPDRRRQFIRFYAIRGSATYSLGAHDEWNIFVRINRKMPTGEQIPMYFDGRVVSPVEIEREISPGYELEQ
jgi:hypothetical protein